MLCMTEKKSKKLGRNFSLPDWINAILDAEAEKCGGLNVVTSSAILTFSRLSNKEKADAVKMFRNEEVDRSYYDADASGVVDGAEADAAKRRQTHGRSSSRAG